MMANKPFDFDRLTREDHDLAHSILGTYRVPDLVIAPDGGEYLYRWHLVRGAAANVYFHIQVESDPERPLHDHPWDSTSVILAGGYEEIVCENPMARGASNSTVYRHRREPGQTVFRPGIWAHRLILPLDVQYSMSLFTTGPKYRDWGFWEAGRFTPFQYVAEETGGQSTWKKGAMA